MATRRVRMGSLGSVLLAIAFGTPQAALGAEPIQADVEGRPIPVDRVARYYCHDLDFPRIHCFSTAARLEAALAGGGTSDGFAVLATPPGTWVTVYRDATYAGTYAYLSRNYYNLSDIGWNDKISSYRVHTSFGGEFWQHLGATGWLFPWAGFQLKPYVGDQWNDQFSSFYRL